MLASEKQVRIAAKMYEARDTCRKLFDEHYNERLKTWMDDIQRISKNQKCSIMEAGLMVLKALDENGASGLAMMLCTAAVVELIEPTTEDSK